MLRVCPCPSCLTLPREPLSARRLPRLPGKSKQVGVLPASFIVRPHPQHAHRAFLLEYLVDQSVLDVDAARISAGKVPYELLVGRRIPEGIVGQDFEQCFGLLPQTGSRELLGIFQRVPGIDDGPLHQRTALALLAKGSAMPFLIDSRMPGTDRR